MISFHFAWFASALTLVLLAGLSFLIDECGRYSLNQLQLVTLTVMIGSTLLKPLAIVIAYLVVTDQTSEYPKFDQSFVTLIGISHAGYVAGKIPDKN